MKTKVLRVVCNILCRAPDIDTVCFMKQRLHKDQVTVVVHFCIRSHSETINFEAGKLVRSSNFFCIFSTPSPPHYLLRGTPLK